MAQAEIRGRADELEAAFARRARANGRTFAQEVDELSASNHRLFAPRLILTEVANALGRKAMAGLMSAAEACAYLRSLPHYFDDVLAVDELIEPALKNACALRHPIYDLIYLEA